MSIADEYWKIMEKKMISPTGKAAIFFRTYEGRSISQKEEKLLLRKFFTNNKYRSSNL